MKELIIEDKYREAAIEASKLLLSTVGSTLGPMGKTVMLMDQHDKRLPMRLEMELLPQL